MGGPDRHHRVGGCRLACDEVVMFGDRLHGRGAVASRFREARRRCRATARRRLVRTLRRAGRPNRATACDARRLDRRCARRVLPRAPDPACNFRATGSKVRRAQAIGLVLAEEGRRPGRAHHEVSGSDEAAGGSPQSGAGNPRCNRRGRRAARRRLLVVRIRLVVALFAVRARCCGAVEDRLRQRPRDELLLGRGRFTFRSSGCAGCQELTAEPSPP
jgi:hypothetical protein